MKQKNVNFFRVKNKLIFKAIRKLTRRLSKGLLPKFLFYKLIRSSLDLSVPLSTSNLSIEVASSLNDLKAALMLVQKNYEQQGYSESVPNSVRLTPYHLLPNTLVIVVKIQGHVVASATLVERTDFGIPLDNALELSDFIKNKGKVVEISALAVDQNVKGQQGEVLFNLMKYLYHCNIDIVKANTEVIGVNPNMKALYEAILLFNKIPMERKIRYDFVNNAPVIPMYFSLDSAFGSYSKIYKGTVTKKNVLEFFLLKPPIYFNLPNLDDLDRILPQRNEADLRQILSWNQTVYDKLPSYKKEIMIKLYSQYPGCQNVFRTLHGN